MASASIDVGSNSLVFLVMNEQRNVMHDETLVVSLGRGLGDGGTFLKDRMEAAMEAFKCFAKTAASFDISPNQINAIATSAARRATNASDFFEDVERTTGIKVRVISGLEEARLTWRGAVHGLNMPTQPFAVVDLGGGSTEIVVGSSRDESLSEQISLEIGTVRLTEMFFDLDPISYSLAQFNDLKAHIAAVVSEVDWSHQPEHIIAVAGTATTLRAMESGLTTWDRELVHGHVLSLADLESWMLALLHSTSEQRQAWAAVSPKRADYMLAGAAVLHAICESSGLTKLTVSDGGIRHGVLLDELQNTQR